MTTLEHLCDTPLNQSADHVGTHRRYRELAEYLDGLLPPGAEKSEAMRCLLDSRDSAFRSVSEKQLADKKQAR